MSTTPLSRAIAGEVPLLWLYEHGASLAGEDPATLADDAGALTRSLQACVEVFGVPAVAPTFDTGLVVDAVRRALPQGDRIETPDDTFAVRVDTILAAPRIQTVLEATDRLTSIMTDASVVGTLTAPGTSVDHLLGTDDPETVEEAWFLVEDVLVGLANAYLDRGADGLLFLDRTDGSAGDRDRNALRPVVNVAQHFEARSVRLVETVTADAVTASVDIGIDAIAGRIENPDDIVAADGSDIALGEAVDPDRLPDPSGSPRADFVTTDGPLSPDVEPEIIHQAVR